MASKPERLERFRREAKALSTRSATGEKQTVRRLQVNQCSPDLTRGRNMTAS
jgi:hypothetical protein